MSVNSQRPTAEPDEEELFLGYDPTFQDLEADWRPTFRQEVWHRSGRLLRRSVRQSQHEPHRRVMVDVGELATAALAKTDHDELRADHQAPADVGPWPEAWPSAVDGFIYPRAAPTFVSFVRGNLVVSLSSFGLWDVQLDPWIASLHRELWAPRPGARQISLAMEPGPGGVWIARVPTLETGTWLRLVGTGGTLEWRRDVGSVVLAPAQEGRAVSVQGWISPPSGTSIEFER